MKVTGEYCWVLTQAVGWSRCGPPESKFWSLISQINPTRCTILVNIFVYFSSLRVSGIHVPIIRRKLLYPCDTGTCHSVRVASGLLVGLNLIQPVDQTPTIQSDKYQCRMDTAIFS